MHFIEYYEITLKIHLSIISPKIAIFDNIKIHENKYIQYSFEYNKLSIFKNEMYQYNIAALNQYIKKKHKILKFLRIFNYIMCCIFTTEYLNKILLRILSIILKIILLKR